MIRFRLARPFDSARVVTRAAQLLTIVCILLLSEHAALSALAGFGGVGGGLPWETPLQTIQNSVTGPVAQALGAIAIVGLGLGVAFSEGGSMMRKALWVVLGLAIAFNTVTLLSSFFNSAGGLLV